MAYYRCGGMAATGDAVAANVLAGKTFSNDSDTGLTGTMTNRGAVTATLDGSTTSYTIPAGYHNGSGTVSISTQTKSASASTSAQTITPDSGKLLTSVSIAAITPQRSAGTAAVASGQDSTGPYVYFPYGWWPNGGSSRNYTRLTAAQAVAACPSQEKTTTPTTRSATAATVTPDSGKLLSKVTVNTNSVPNTNSGTKTITSSDANWITGNVDMGAANSYRYVNAVNVYNKGKSDGKMALILQTSSDEYSHVFFFDEGIYSTLTFQGRTGVGTTSTTITFLTKRTEINPSTYGTLHYQGTRIGNYSNLSFGQSISVPSTAGCVVITNERQGNAIECLMQ